VRGRLYYTETQNSLEFLSFVDALPDRGERPAPLRRYSPRHAKPPVLRHLDDRARHFCAAPEPGRKDLLVAGMFRLAPLVGAVALLLPPPADADAKLDDEQRSLEADGQVHPGGAKNAP
jgi:hypothetical protein